MTHLMFIPNNHSVYWIPMKEGPVEQWVESVRSGEWRLPWRIERGFYIPEGLRYKVRQHDGLWIVRPNCPLVSRLNTSPPPLTAAQQQALEMVAAGHTYRHIALALKLTVRQVGYMLKQMRAEIGVQSTAELLRLRLDLE